jgi:hypothetical protein
VTRADQIRAVTKLGFTERQAGFLVTHLVVHLAWLDSRRVVTEVVRVRDYDPQDDRFVVEAWSPPQAVQEGATA